MKVWSWRDAVRKSDLKPTTRHVLLTLSLYMNDLGQGCFPSVSQLAEDTGLSKPAIINNIKLAEESGFISKQKRNLKGQKWAANEYEARLPEGVNLDNPLEGEGVKEVYQRGKASLPQGVKEVYTNSPIELSNEHSNKKEKEIKRKKTGNYSEEFEQFWKTYPAYRRKNKTDAFKLWKEAIKIATAEEILIGLQGYLETSEVGDGYTPYPAKWLKNERWGEEHIPADMEVSHESSQDKKHQDRMRYEQIRDDLKFGAYVPGSDKQWYSKYRRGETSGYG